MTKILLRRSLSGLLPPSYEWGEMLLLNGGEDAVIIKADGTPKDLLANQAISLSGDVSGIGSTSINVTLANSGVTSGDYTKVSVDAKGRVVAGANLAESDIPDLTHTKIGNFTTAAQAAAALLRLDQLATSGANLNLGGYRVTNAGTPLAGTDLVNKAYADGLVQGLDIKASVRAATTEHIPTTPTVLDGITLNPGDRILVKNQTTPETNGIYIFAGEGEALVRASDSDTSEKVTTGMYTFVEEGIVNAGLGFSLITPGPISLGVTGLTFTAFSGGGSTIAGTGLTQSGNTISIDSAYAGQSSIVTVGAITTGTWQATPIAAAHIGNDLTVSKITDFDSAVDARTATAIDTAFAALTTIDAGTF
jgi:hypothetical protein